MFKKALMLLVFCFSCLMISCRTMRQEIQKTENETKSTNERTVTYKDTTIFAPKAETSLKIPVSEIGFKGDLKDILKPKIYTQTNGQAKVKIKIVGDTLQATATCDSLAIVAKIKKELQRETFSQHNKSDTNINSKSGLSLFHVFAAFFIGFVAGYLLNFLKSYEFTKHKI